MDFANKPMAAENKKEIVAKSGGKQLLRSRLWCPKNMQVGLGWTRLDLFFSGEKIITRPGRW